MQLSEMHGTGRVRIYNFRSSSGPYIRSCPFNFSTNDLFYITEITSICNFADDNTLTAFAKTMPELIKSWTINQ